MATDIMATGVMATGFMVVMTTGFTDSYARPVQYMHTRAAFYTHATNTTEN